MNENIEQMDFFEILDSMYNQYLESKEEEERIHQKMNEEIEEAKRKIKAYYQKKITSSKSNTLSLERNLEIYRKNIENYSTFDVKMIGSIIEKLMSFVEGEEYSLMEATHDTYEYETTVFGSESFKVHKKVFMIVKGTQRQGYYHDYNKQENEIDKLVRDNKALLLSERKDYFNEVVTFYTVNDGKIQSLKNFNQFSYVKDFIDFVVQYRFQNQLDNISEKELLKLMNEFILSRKEMIEENYKKRLLEKQEQLRKQVMDMQVKQGEDIEQTEIAVTQNVPSRYQNPLMGRLQERAEESVDFSRAIGQFEISYEGEKNIASITCSEPFISTENILISKIDIVSSIKGYFDNSDPDPHFHGICDIDLVDDGLIGIVDISGLKQNLDAVMTTLPNGLYKVDNISDEYLRVLYLPNKGKYSHKPINVYDWIMDGILNQNDSVLAEKGTSYKTKWNCTEEVERMLTYLKEIELLSYSKEKQLKLYK